MSPEEPRYLPSGAGPTEPSPIQQTPDERHAAWSRGDETARPLTAVRSRSLFAFLEVAYPLRPRLPQSLGWGALYGTVGFLICLFFWIFAQILPAIVIVVPMMVWYIKELGMDFMASKAGQEFLNEQAMAPMLIAGHLVAIPLGILFLRLLLGPDWTGRLAMRRPAVWHLFLTLLTVPAVIVLSNGVIVLVKKAGLPNMGELLGLPGGMGVEQMVKMFGTWPWLLAVAVIGVGPAISEELWCRGLLGLGLLGRNGIVARLLVSSFYFGLLHVDPQQGTMAAVMGLILYFILLTTRCFWMPVLLHFCNNSVSVIAARFESTKDIDENLPWYIYAGAGALIVAILISFFRTHARLKSEREFEQPVWEPTYSGVEHPPPGCGVVVAYPRPGLLDVGIVTLGAATFGCAIAWATLHG